MHAAWRLRAKLLPASCHQAYHRHMYTYVSSIVLSNFMYTLTTWLGQYILSTAKYLQSHDVRSAKLNYIHKRKNIDIFISWCCHISDRNVLIWYIRILVSEAPSYYECLLDRYDEIDNGCFVVGVFFLEVHTHRLKAAHLFFTAKPLVHTIANIWSHSSAQAHVCSLWTRVNEGRFSSRRRFHICAQHAASTSTHTDQCLNPFCCQMSWSDRWNLHWDNSPNTSRCHMLDKSQRPLVKQRKFENHIALNHDASMRHYTVDKAQMFKLMDLRAEVPQALLPLDRIMPQTCRRTKTK